MQIFRLPGEFRRHMQQYENDKREVSRRYRQQLKETTEQMHALNNHTIDTQNKFKKVNNKMDKLKDYVKNDLKECKNEIREELEQKKDELKNYVNTELNKSDVVVDALEKRVRQQKQKFDNYKQQTNKRFIKVEQQMDKLNTDNRSLLDMLKYLIFGKNDSKKNITFEDKDYATNGSINNFDLSKSFTSMNLRRTNSCFFSINTNDDNRNNNSNNNSFTVFNRKNDIVPNLEEEDIKENNK